MANDEALVFHATKLVQVARTSRGCHRTVEKVVEWASRMVERHPRISTDPHWYIESAIADEKCLDAFIYATEPNRA